MRVPVKCILAAMLCCSALSILAQEDGNAVTAESQEQAALDPYALAVLPPEVLTDDPKAPALAAQAYEAMLQELASIDGLYVIPQESVLPYVDAALGGREIGQQLGVRYVLESRVEAQASVVSLQAGVQDAVTGGGRGMHYILYISPNIRIENPPFDRNTLMPDMAAGVADIVRSALFPAANPQPDRQQDPQAGYAEAELTVLDTSLSDNERLDALKRLPRRRELAYGGSVVIAAAQLATSARESGVRYSVWQEMARVDDPYLIQPLLHTLANDVDEGVRRISGENLLRNFIDEPGVRAALEHAAANDPSEWVRDRIRRSMLPEAERHAELLTILLDSTKPDMERLGAAYGLNRSNESPVIIRDSNELSRDEITAIMGLARTTRSRRVRADALRLLHGVDDPDLVEPFLIALANDSYEHVRDVAAANLSEFLDQTGVREALEEALANDPSPLVRKTAGESLASVER